jgi:hypothetical protein
VESIGDSAGEPGSSPEPGRQGARRAVIGLVTGVALVLAAAGVGLSWATNSDTPAEPTMSMGAGPTDARFAELTSAKSNYCSLDAQTVMGYPDDHRMQGACCNPMDRDKYRQQVDGLRRYAEIPEVPKDPYDIEAGLAKRLLGYDETITLDAGEQATFDEAMGMTEDGGPCCCQCWRWDMTEGLAKFLITEHDMPADEVAEIADLTNGCGGPPGASDGS